MARPVKKLTHKMIIALDMYVANPSLSQADIARALGKHVNTICNWFSSDVFKEEVDKRFKKKWEEAAKEAQSKMYDLMKNGKEDVSFRATQYILDCNGYKPKEQVELSGNLDIEINITNDKA